jgi:hypothetical protein
MSESNSQIPRLRHPLYKGGINSHLILSYGTYFMIINGITQSLYLFSFVVRVDIL